VALNLWTLFYKMIILLLPSSVSVKNLSICIDDYILIHASCAYASKKCAKAVYFGDKKRQVFETGSQSSTRDQRSSLEMKNS
jgi:hypothetical protein